MLKLSWIRINNKKNACITDKHPNISFALESDINDECLKNAVISCDNTKWETTDQINNIFTGELKPFTEYNVNIKATGTSGDTAEGNTSFQTGRLARPWIAKWITDIEYDFPKKVSPVPMYFKYEFSIEKKIKKAWINSTALGVYELVLNGKKIGNDYFAPGLTSYEHQIQYQTNDVTNELNNANSLLAIVAGAWAVGSFTYRRKNKISADRQAFLCELHIQYEDGESEIIATNEEWQVSQNGNYQAAEWYDGEIYDARINLNKIKWKKADVTKPRGTPKLIAQYGESVRVHEILKPISCFKSKNNELIYDFGQNFSGVISAFIKGTDGQKIIFRHSEVIVDGELFVKSLRTAKAAAIYYCKDGEQQYSPRLTFMGFRYVGVSGIKEEDINICAFVLHSDFEEIGSFECSNELLNKLQRNIRWGGKSNFIDIPTDCPQRDERMGWTGDIAVFAQTACFNFDMSSFFEKWLLDMRCEQGKGGGIPMVIPRAGDTWPVMANSCWGDSCILVPWAEYLARGNIELLKDQYPAIKRFLKAAKWWSNLFSLTPNNRYIWQFPFHFGDWCAPNETIKQWMAKGKWIATAFFANSCNITAKIADILGYHNESKYYHTLAQKITRAYRNIFTDKQGNLKKEFQTAYVLPLYFKMTAGNETEIMAKNLSRLVCEAGNHLATGFTGTPYILFALSDNGQEKAAFDLLLQETNPSWLYSVKAGATTIWERWDALRPDGTVNTDELTGEKKGEEGSGGMVSFNHYANGAVGDWLYRRIAGIEPTSGGYKTFKIAPLLGGGITWSKGKTETPYGTIVSNWNITDNKFTINVVIPVSTQCNLILPNKEKHLLSSGTYIFSCDI